MGNHKSGPVINYLVRAQGTPTRVGAGQGVMGGAGEGPGQVGSSTCGLESGGIQRVRFRMQKWGGAEVGGWVLSGGQGLPQGLGTLLKAQGSLAGELPW